MKYENLNGMMKLHINILKLALLKLKISQQTII